MALFLLAPSVVFCRCCCLMNPIWLACEKRQSQLSDALARHQTCNAKRIGVRCRRHTDAIQCREEAILTCHGQTSITIICRTVPLTRVSWKPSRIYIFFIITQRFRVVWRPAATPNSEKSTTQHALHGYSSFYSNVHTAQFATLLYTIQ